MCLSVNAQFGISEEEQIRMFKNAGFDGILTFELTTLSKPGRRDNDKYAKMAIEDYITECYARACRVAFLKNDFSEENQ